MSVYRVNLPHMVAFYPQTSSNSKVQVDIAAGSFELFWLNMTASKQTEALYSLAVPTLIFRTVPFG